MAGAGGSTLKDVHIFPDASDLEIYKRMLAGARLSFSESRSFHRPSRQESVDVYVSAGRCSVTHVFSAEDGRLLDVEPDSF